MDYSSEFAALTTFRKIIDSGSNLFVLIDDFILFSIVFHGYTYFDAEQIVTDINEEFNFEIPVSVIRDSIKRLRKKNNIGFDRTNGYKNNLSSEAIIEIEKLISEYESEKAEIQSNNNELLHYVRKKLYNATIDESRIFDIFRSLILGKSDVISEESKLVSVIGTFILKKNEENSLFVKTWEIIKSSVIIREALVYNNDILTEKIKNLCIYLDMEILFDGFGLNGTIYKKLYEDFKKLVEKLNSRGCRISLLYFDYTRDDIDFYFSKALQIYDNRPSMVPETTAMQNILRDCRTRSTIIEKKMEFYKFINENDVKLVSSSAYTAAAEKIRLNQISNTDDDPMTDYLYRHQKNISPISYIKILRNSRRSNKLTEITHIFATRTKLFLRSAGDECKSPDEISCAVDTEYLINKFWISSGDGFGATNNHSNTISFVQRILSEEKRIQITREHKRLVENPNNLERSELQLKIAALRKIESAPEYIQSDSFDQKIDEEIENILNSKESLTLEIAQHQKTKKHLEETTKQQQEIKRENEALNRKISMKIEELKTEMSQLKNQKQDIDKESDRISGQKITIIKIIGLVVIVVIDILISIFVPKYWQIFEGWIWVVSFIFTFTMGYITLLLISRELNVKKAITTIEMKIKNKYRIKRYKLIKFNPDRIADIEKEIEYFNS